MLFFETMGDNGRTEVIIVNRRGRLITTCIEKHEIWKTDPFALQFAFGKLSVDFRTRGLLPIIIVYHQVSL